MNGLTPRERLLIAQYASKKKKPISYIVLFEDADGNIIKTKKFLSNVRDYAMYDAQKYMERRLPNAVGFTMKKGVRKK